MNIRQVFTTIFTTIGILIFIFGIYITVKENGATNSYIRMLWYSLIALGCFLIAVLIVKPEPDNEIDICKCGHHIRDHSYKSDNVNSELDCDLCKCQRFDNEK